jgi:hypothetical protein
MAAVKVYPLMNESKAFPASKSMEQLGLLLRMLS